MTKYIIAICCPFFLIACGNNTAAKTPPPEYVFQTTTANFDYTAWKDNKSAAIDRINRRMDYHSKNACYAIGYGWGLHKVINPGEVNCEVNSTNKRIRCRRENVELDCTRLKPGSVGMGMIPFTQ